MKHPLRSAGSSQAGRLVRALTPDFFRLDERSMQDLIHAAYEYAQLLRYHGPDSPPGDNWAGFWEIENLTYLAILAALDTDQIRKGYDDIDREFGLALEDGAPKKKGKRSSGDTEAKYFRRLIRYTRDTARRLERYFQTLRPDIPLKALLLQLIRRENDFEYNPDDIESGLQQLIAWNKAWDDQLRPESYRAFFHPDHRWGVRNRDEYDCILPDDSLNDRDQIRALFLRSFNTLLAVKTRAQQLFDAEILRLERPEDVDPRPLAPHISLFITFLNLFRHAQDSLNELTQTHLDFYYEKVLCLERKPAGPDHAYLVFTLAKEFNDELIEKGTPLLAGKDKKGQPIRFETLEQWRVTRAKVEEVKNIYLDKDQGLILAAEAANMADGVAAPLKPMENWRLFGDVNKAGWPEGEVGFALASPQLILLEGLRTINLNFLFTSNISNPLKNTSNYRVFITGEEDWVELNKAGSNTLNTNAYFQVGSDAANSINIRITIPHDVEPLKAPGEKWKAPRINSQWPMVKVIIGQNYTAILNRLVTSSLQNIEINVAASDIRKNLLLKNDFAVTDGTERFFPFGNPPEETAQFHVGSAEIFQKKLDTLTFHLNWVDAPPDFSTYYNKYFSVDTTKLLGATADFLVQENASFGVPRVIKRVGLGGETVSIHVWAEDEPLVGATITIQGTSIGAPTGTDGSVTLTLPPSMPSITLIVSNPGFHNTSIDVQHFRDFTIFLQPEDQSPSLYLPNQSFSLIESNKIKSDYPINQENLPTQRDIRIQSISEFDETLARGFVRVVFRKGDFLHKIFPQTLTEKAFALANPPIGLLSAEPRAVAAAETETSLPKTPWTPQVNGISADYTSTQVFEAGIDQFFHILPWDGYQEIEAQTNSAPVYPFNRTQAYLGLSNHIPGDNLSLLIQTAEGSEPDPEALPPKINWSYLAKNNEWKDIPPQLVLRDSTYGLTRSGLLQLSIPTDISSEGNTILNPALLWLRATTIEETLANGIERTVRALPSLLDIRAQALEAVFVPNDRNDLLRLAEPLEAGSISKLAEGRDAVKKVEQPFPTFGGRLPEVQPGNAADKAIANAEYYRRIRERLRHKDRAVTAWDYERLLLEQYPQVAVAKCIPHTRYEAVDGFENATELAPGFVTVAVIPDLLRRPTMVREQPRFARGDLYEMRDALLPKTNLFLQPILADPTDPADTDDHFLQVVNPQYEPVHVAVSVWLKRGADRNLALYQINEILRQYLAPWLYDPAKGPVFQREIRRSKLIQLIEEMDAVDVVRWLKVFQVVLKNGQTYPTDPLTIVADNNPPTGSKPEHLDPSVVLDLAIVAEWQSFEVHTPVIRPNTARSILTTAEEHQILFVDDTAVTPAPRKALAPPPSAAAGAPAVVSTPVRAASATAKPEANPSTAVISAPAKKPAPPKKTAPQSEPPAKPEPTKKTAPTPKAAAKTSKPKNPKRK